MIYLGIDPGMSGGIAVLEDGCEPSLMAMPATELDVLRCLGELRLCAGMHAPMHCALEKVHAFKGQGVTSSFTFGKGYGGLRMALLAAEIPFEDVTPQRWMKHFGMKKDKGETKTAWKHRLKGLAQQRFPGAKVTLKTADALLLALYAKETKCRT